VKSNADLVMTEVKRVYMCQAPRCEKEANVRVSGIWTERYYCDYHAGQRSLINTFRRKQRL